jgi:predicted AAA+ superfamily ATPase
MYSRIITNNIHEWLDNREIIILKGARQVGKTTLIKTILEGRDDAIIINCELPNVASILESFDLEAVKALFSGKHIIALDEAQTVGNIGKLLKLIYDEMPQYKLIVSGSSSFELVNQLGEPLTGRNVKYTLFPLSIEEIRDKTDWVQVMNHLNSFLVFGTYPGLIDLDMSKKQKKLLELTSDYLFKDILIYEQLKSPTLIRQLLKALALQVSSEVSINELSNLLGASRPVVENYLDILEKNYIIFRLESFSGNLRNEIKKSRKYYFYDNGIMNAVTGNLNLIQNRSDTGALWENFCISERKKYNEYHQRLVNMYFWRTFDKAEIDLVEEQSGVLTPFEFKWNERKTSRLPASFAKAYEVSELTVVSPTKLHLLISH